MYKDKYQKTKQKHDALKIKHKEQRQKFQKEIKAFRSSAEEVLNELIKRWAISDLVTVAVTQTAKKVAYKEITAFDFKQYIDTVIEPIGEFHGDTKDFVEYLRVDNGDVILKEIEEQIAAKVNDYAVKMFFMERELLNEE
jgi:hypothetical protein